MFLDSITYQDGINQDFRVNQFPNKKIQTLRKSVNCSTVPTGNSLKNRL